MKKFNDAVAEADKTSSELKKTLASVFSTAIIAGFAQKAIRAFSDLQESTQKFYEVFKGLEKDATAEAKKLEEQFGASTRSAKSMLALSGDLLTGFGFSRDEALKLSAQIAQLGSDIASFSNYAGGAEGATIAITKAMLGETEMAKMLGIAIKTDSQEYKELYKRIKETRGTTDSQTKALTALHIAFQQKGTAMGDFERNIDSVANRGRILSNTMETLEANIGRGLAEGFNEAQGVLIELAKTFNDLDEPTQDFIVQTGAIFSGLMIAKTAYGVYNFFSAQAGSIAANNAIQAQAEAKAHIANAAAIESENKAKQTNQVVSAQRALKENRVEVQKARHTWRSALVAGEDPRKVEQLRQSYKNLLVERKNLFKASEIAQGNQVIKGFNNSVALANRQLTQMDKVAFPGMARGMAKLKAGFHGIGVAARSVGVALKGMMASMLPMLALSAVIEGIMWFAGKAKREAEAANEIASKQTESVKNEIQANETLRKQDQDKLRRYEELAKLSDRTKSEQEELISISGNLNKSYNGLNIPLLKQNDILKDTSKLWNEINAKQKQQMLDEQKRLLIAKHNEIRGYELFIYSNHMTGPNRGWLKDIQNAAAGYAKINKLKEAINAAAARKDSKGYSEFNKLLMMYQDLWRAQQDYRDLASGATAEKEKVQNQSKLNEIIRAEKEKFDEIVRKSNYDQMLDEQKLLYLEKQLSDFRKKESFYEQRQNSEENVKKLFDYKKKILDTQKEIDNLNERIEDSYSKEADMYEQYAEKVKRSMFEELDDTEKLIILNERLNNLKAEQRGYKTLGDVSGFAKTGSDIWDVEQSIKEINKRQAQAKEEEEKVRLNIWQEFANAARGLKQTTQEAIHNYSMEGIRLQSRMLLMPKMDAPLQEAKKQTLGLMNIKSKLDEYRDKIDSMSRSLEDIQKGLQVTDY